MVGGIIALGLRELGISGKVNTKISWIYRHYIILCRCLVNRILSCSVTGTVKNGVDCVPKGTVNHGLARHGRDSILSCKLVHFTCE